MADVIDAIIAESLGEGPEGMAAVAHVIATRAAQTGKTPEQVVNEAGQFSGVSNPGSSVAKAMKDPAIRAQVEEIWSGVTSGQIPNPFPGADFFHTPQVDPHWNTAFNRLGQTGNHIFYASGNPANNAVNAINAAAPTPRSASARPTAARGTQMAGPFTNKDGEGYTREVQWNGYDANLKPEVVQVLNKAQQLVDFPIVLNSGYRSPERNKRVKGASKSQHLTGNAVDISLRGLNDQQRTQLTRALAQSGGKRLIAYTGNTKMHLDMASGYKPQKGYSAYAMFDRSAANMDRAYPWFKAGLDGGKTPPGNIPNVASAYAPSPQLISAGLGNARSNPPPLPRWRPIPATPSATDDRSWMNDYGRVIDQHQPQRPTGRQASLGPPQFTNWQSDYRDIISQHQPRPPMREPVNPPRMTNAQPWNITLQPQFRDGGQRLAAPVPQGTAAAVPQGTAAGVPQRTIVGREPPPVPMPRSGAISARANNPMLAIPEADAERMWAGTQFAPPQPPSLPPLPIPRPQMGPVPQHHPHGLAERIAQRPQAPQMMPPAPFPATMSAALARSRIPQPMPAFMRPSMQQAPLNITVPGNRPAPIPQPRLQRADPVRTARNGYVYALGDNGPVTIGTTRPRGMTPQQDYDRRAAAARRSSPDNGGNPSWW
jgi:hypothetical protein